jgi:transposase
LEKLVVWLQGHTQEPLHACMEATSSYWEASALALREAGHTVSVVNPKFIHNFGKVLNARTKNDAADAELIARYCQTMQPAAWQPRAEERVRLARLVRRRDDYVAARTQELNRLKGSGLDPDERKLIEEHLAFLERSIEEVERLVRGLVREHDELTRQVKMLRTIPGVGEVTAWTMLGKVPSVDCFESPKQMAAYCGVTPREFTSGSSVRGRTIMSKMGAKKPRRALYMAACTAKQRRPEFQAFAKRLADRGKSRKSTTGAVMRKLVHIIYGVLKHQVPYNPELAFGPVPA